MPYPNGRVGGGSGSSFGEWRQITNLHGATLQDPGGRNGGTTGFSGGVFTLDTAALAGTTLGTDDTANQMWYPIPLNDLEDLEGWDYSAGDGIELAVKADSLPGSATRLGIWAFLMNGAGAGSVGKGVGWYETANTVATLANTATVAAGATGVTGLTLVGARFSGLGFDWGGVQWSSIAATPSNLIDMEARSSVNDASEWADADPFDTPYLWVSASRVAGSTAAGIVTGRVWYRRITGPANLFPSLS